MAFMVEKSWRGDHKIPHWGGVRDRLQLAREEIEDIEEVLWRDDQIRHDATSSCRGNDLRRVQRTFTKKKVSK